MNYKIQNVYFDTVSDTTKFSLVSDDKDFLMYSSELQGDQTKQENLVQLALDQLFKKVFVDRAMTEAIEKVDKVSIEIDETRTTLNELREAMDNAKTLISYLDNKTQHIEQKQNKINEAFVLSDNLSEEQKAILFEQFKEWTVGETYGKDEVVNYNGVLYRVIKGITAQAHYLPDSVPSEYTPLRNTTTVIDGETVEVISDFVQPTGAHDAYEKGDKVRFNGKVYESILDQPNTWSPADYPQGWKEVA